MDVETSFISADFSSFEDFSARMILLPRDDDECTGAKVGSHEVPAEIIADEVESPIKEQQAVADEDEVESPTKEQQDAPANEGDESMVDVETDGPKNDNDDGTAAKDVGESSGKSDPNANTDQEDRGLDEGTSQKGQSEKNDPNTNSYESRELDVETPQNHMQQHAMQVPVGYVLVEIKTLNDIDTTNDIPEDLENIEFGDLLCVLREASFPLSLVFAPPTDTPTSQGSFFDEDENAKHSNKGSAQTTPTDSSSSGQSSDDDDSTASNSEAAQSLPTLVSREDAKKYAKEAAAELRGRFSRWGYQAAARAADAASQVKELREERQRKLEEEQEGKEDQDGDDARGHYPSETGDDTEQPKELPERAEATENAQPQDMPVEASPALPDGGSGEGEKKVEEPLDPCFIFLQTPSGFEQLPNDYQCDTQKSHWSVTNTSVVSVRLSEEKACPIGKNGGYSFQWYRSNDGSETTKDPNGESANNDSDSTSMTWSPLCGANYAAYQPSVSDAGHRLKCIIKHDIDGNQTLQTCQLPCLVAIDPSLFNSVKMTLLSGKKSVTFGNLRRMDDLTMFRLKIDVDSDDDFICSCSIFIDSGSGASAEESGEERMEPVSHFKAAADPAKPKLFYLICSSHGRLTLDAANRKSRESLLLALGIANFKGKLSSLTTSTNLFPCYESEAELYTKENGPSSNGSVGASKMQSDVISNDSADNTHSQKIEAMHRLLESKDIATTKLQRELVALEKELESSRKSERSSRVALERCETTLKEKVQTIESINKSQREAEIVQERTLKALTNEKAVLQAAVEARDGKIEGLTNQVSELQKRAKIQTEQLSSMESLKSNLAQTQEKCSTAERIIAKMQEAESELQQDLKSAKEIVLDLSNKFSAAQETASKRESDCRKLKMERSSLKNKAEGLSKEMHRMRISKNSEEALEMEKSKAEIQRLTRENGDLQEQVDVAQAEKRDAMGKLEATRLAHEQSISSFQRSSDGNMGTDQRIGELESVISSMTEYLNAKEMQIETLKEVNRALSEDVSKLSQP